MCKPIRNQMIIVGLLVSCVIFSGCNEGYVTPQHGTNLTNLTTPDAEPVKIPTSIQQAWQTAPACDLPVNLAIVRIQSGYNVNQFHVVNTRDIEQQEDMERIRNLPEINQVLPLSQLLVSGEHNSDQSLRRAAASSRADMLLIYTIDSKYDESDWSSAVSIATLGLAPTVKVKVTTTVSAVLMDVRTGFVYGAIEATEQRAQKAAFVTRQNAWDQCSAITVQKAFQGLITRFESFWPEIVKECQDK